MSPSTLTYSLRNGEHRLSLEPIIAIARQAGEAIMAIYQAPFEVNYKADQTPVTQADEAANQLITQALRELTALPVLAEEGPSIRWQDRQYWRQYWLVDPLDGTREFIQRNDDFTVNIALIQNHQPVLGVVHAPVSGESWFAARDMGSWHQSAVTAEKVRNRVAPLPENTTQWSELISRSHDSAPSRTFAEALGDHERTPVGSSLKHCRIAQGQGHIHARLGPTCEWDTAASQVILEEAGGLLVHAETLRPLRYNTRNRLLNPWFVSACAHDTRWHRAVSRALHQHSSG